MEGLAVVGIISSIITLVEYSTDVVERFVAFAGDTKEVPKHLTNLRIILPLVADTLERTRCRVNANEVNERTCKAIRPVLDGCKAKMEELKRILANIVPKDGAGKFIILWKAVRSTFQDDKIEKIAGAIRDYIQVLTFHHAEAAELSAAQKSAFTTAMARMTISDTADADDAQGTKGLCLLSLDGGGVRGLSILVILGDIMAKVNEARDPPLKPCELFDLIGGTGTGALIAIMLGRLRMDIEDCITAYKAALQQIVESHGSSNSQDGEGEPLLQQESLLRAISELLQTCNIPLEEKFAAGGPRKCLTFVCAAAKETQEVVLIRDYLVSGQRSRNLLSIKDAARATISSPNLFPPVVVDGRTYMGGDLRSNNPIYHVWSEAQKTLAKNLDPEQHLKCLVSIGTGNLGISSFNPDKLTEELQKIATETEITAQEFSGLYPKLLDLDNKRLFRFNVEQGLQDVKWNILEFGLIEAVTERYLDQGDQKIEVERCARNLQVKQTQEVAPITSSPSHHRKDYAELEAIAQRALLENEKQKGPVKASILEPIELLERLYSEQGKWADLETMLLRERAIRAQLFGANHETTLIATFNLGVALEQRGKYADAERAWEQAHAEFRKINTPKSQGLAQDCLRNIGNVSIDLENFDKAERMYRRALSGNEKLHGVDGEETLGCAYNLARILAERGKIEEAEETFQRVLEGYRRTIGPNTEKTLATLNYISGWYADIGRAAQAEEMAMKVVSIKVETLGTDNISTLMSKYNLAVLLKRFGDTAKAQATYEEALPAATRVLNSPDYIPMDLEHAGVLDIPNNLANIYADQGGKGRARELYHQSLAAKERVLGPSHQSTMGTAKNILLM